MLDIVESEFEALHAQLLKEKAAIVAQPRRARLRATVKGRYIPAPRTVESGNAIKPSGRS